MIRAVGAVRVVHRHRIGARVFTRVSELSFLHGKPIVVLTWLHKGGQRIPGVFVALEEDKLRAGANRRIFSYTGITCDPRFPPRPSSG
jgi:hypothetical protein